MPWSLLDVFDLTGTIAFDMSGAFAGIHKKMDLLDAMLLGFLTVLILRNLTAHFRWNLPEVES